MTVCRKASEVARWICALGFSTDCPNLITIDWQLDIHGWKAMDLRFNLAPSYRDLKDPRSLQNFDDTPGQIPKLILTLRPKTRWQNISQIDLFFLFAANRQTFSGFFFPQLWLDRLWRWGRRRLKSETRDAKLVWGDPHPHHHILLILMLPLWAWTGYNALIGFYRTLKLSTSFSFVHIWCLWE